MKGGGRLTERSSPKESASSSHKDHRSVNTDVFTSLLCSQQERVCRCLGSSVAIPPDLKEKATAFRKEAFTQRSPSPTLGPPPWGALKHHQQKLPAKTDRCLQGSTYNLPGANSIFTTSPPEVVKGNVRPPFSKVWNEPSPLSRNSDHASVKWVLSKNSLPAGVLLPSCRMPGYSEVTSCKGWQRA